jgi:hypothetical protein
LITKLKTILKKTLAWAAVRKGVLSVVVLAILAALLFSFLGAHILKSSYSAVFPTFLSSIILNTSAAFLALLMGTSKLQKQIDDLEQLKYYGQARQFWVSIMKSGMRFHIVHGHPFRAWDDDKDSNSSVATLLSVLEIERMLPKLLSGSVVTRCHYEGRGDEFKMSLEDPSNHIIIVGGPKSIGCLESLQSKAMLTIRHQTIGDENVLSKGWADDPPFKASRYPNDARKSDYGLITVLRPKDCGNRRIIWIYGNYGIGTYGGILLLFRQDGSCVELKDPQPGDYHQFVIKVDNIPPVGRIEADHRDIEQVEDPSNRLPTDLTMDDIIRILCDGPMPARQVPAATGTGPTAEPRGPDALSAVP